MPTAIGRDLERAAVERLLDSGLTRLSVLILEGEAGIGKTTVWRDAVQSATERGYLALACHPAQSETTFAYASLADLLEPVDDEVFAKLPVPQRNALEVALLRAGPGIVAAQARAVAAGLVTLLRELARSQPVLLGIDDVQWLDPETSNALAFALRRLGDQPLAIILSQRTEGRGGSPPLGLHGGLTEQVEVARIGPLNLGALYHLLRHHLNVTYSRPVLRRIEDASGGNPLFALELARVYESLGHRPGPGEPLPLGRLTELIAARITALPVATKEALLLIATKPDATDEVVVALVGEKGHAALERAVRAKLIEPAGGGVRFAHPLYASTVLSAASARERLRMHQRLAEVVADPEERARHLALGSNEPDEEIAAALEAAASRAAKRGAPDAGSELLELAIRKTPTTDHLGVARRRLELVELTMRAGDSEEAMRHVSVVLEAVAEGPLRARALERQAWINHTSGTWAAGVAACDEALRQPDLDVELRARIHAIRSSIGIEGADVAERDANMALELLDQLEAPDPVVLVAAISARIGLDMWLGRPLPQDLVDRGLELERIAPNPVVADRLSAALGTFYKYAGDLSAARYWLELTHQTAIDEGDEGSMPYAASHLPQLELWSGNWSAAERWAEEHMELAERTGQANQRISAIYNLAQVHAHLGRVEEANREAGEALAEAEAAGSDWDVWTLGAVLGFAALSAGDNENAVAHLARAIAVGEKMQDAEPRRSFGDYAEALVAVGQPAEAARVAEDYVSKAETTGNSLLLPNALRARALCAAAEQRFGDATTAIEEALTAHLLVEAPFDYARTLLAAGQIRRRIGERRSARDALIEARDIFSKLGAPLWERRASEELARVPIRRSAGTTLTETEGRVAVLAAEGRSNREIAQALFISVKTVEANLGRIYTKLGVRSRSALASKLANSKPGESPPKL